MKVKYILLLSIFMALIFSMICIKEIKKDKVSVFNSNDKINEKEIIKKILYDTDNKDKFQNIDNIKLECFKANLIDKDDTVFVLYDENKNFLITVYEVSEDNYIYKSIIGNFVNVKDIKIHKLKKENKDTIFITEHINQKLGSFEESTFIKGYIFKEGNFSQILNLTKYYKAYYNEFWVGNGYWFKILQDANINFKKNNELAVTYNQKYLKGKDFNKVDIPKDKDFILSNSKTFNTNYIWSEKWDMYILCEAVFKENKENVAILEVPEQSPFYITELKKNNIYKIITQKGEIKVINKNDLIFNQPMYNFQYIFNTNNEF